MKQSLPKYLEDVRLSISDIESYVSRISTIKAIEENHMVFDALCRRFAIIGEAIYQANKIDANIEITDKNKIIGLRHIIIHDYDVVKAQDLWQIIVNKLPLLKNEIEKLLKKF